MPTNTTIALRPRFRMALDHDHQSVLKVFEQYNTPDFKISRVDDHVFIRLPRSRQHFWSPQLHLEINSVADDKSMLHGLYGPNPTVWTMFMFLHFFVAGLFIAFGIWTYTHWKLEKPYGIQLGLMVLMVVLWLVLYVAGRLGRNKGKPEMHQLNDFMKDTLKANDFI